MPQLDKPGEFNSIKLAKGVYASLVTIAKITDLSNHPDFKRPENRRTDGEPYQLCIEVGYQRDDGADWSTRFYGNWKADAVTGKIKGWSTFGNGVYSFFTLLLGSHEELETRLNDNYTISQLMIEPLIGRKFYRISYINGIKDDGKGRYKDWNQIFLEDATIENMQNIWARASVKMKSYTPDAVDELERMKPTEDTKFNYGANVEKDIEQSVLPEEEFEL